MTKKKRPCPVCGFKPIPLGGNQWITCACKNKKLANLVAQSERVGA